MEQAAIVDLVQNRIEASQNIMLERLDGLISSRFNSFQSKIHENQRVLSDTQIAKIEQINNESYKFNKKGNQEQYKSNARVYQKLKETDAILKEDPAIDFKTKAAQEKIAEGISLLQYRQKLIKMADSSTLGWMTAEEYEINRIADDSEDEKKMQKAENSALRKSRLKTQKRFGRFNRTHPYRLEVTSNTATNTKMDSQTGTGFRRPGMCFACGKPGHWRFECKEVTRENKISTFSYYINSESIEQYAHLNMFDSGNKVTKVNGEFLSPVGRLRFSLNKWQAIGANKAVLEVIKCGYKLPFHTIPVTENLKNNKSALQHVQFVSEEILSLLKKGCITEVSEKPHVINPLTVAGNKSKLRLVLDCRHINPHLYKLKFKYEDYTVAKDIFKKGFYVFGFDLKSAYHHIEIFEEHRKYLGFSWIFGAKRRYFIFNVLPFGISTAGYIFTKVTRSLVTHWRSVGYKIVMYLDDGMGGSSELSECLQVSEKVQLDLKQSGFLIAHEKCNWTPSVKLTWLGIEWDFSQSKICITEKRIKKLLGSIEDLFKNISKNIYVLVRELASIIGQIISLQAVVGKTVVLQSRELFRCVNYRASWNSRVVVSDAAQRELRFWLENVREKNKAELESISSYSVNVFTDASSTGYGGYIQENSGCYMFGIWSLDEVERSSTWRELEAVLRMLYTYEKCLEGQCVQWYTDNKNIVSIIEKGSMKPDLQEKAIVIQTVCEHSQISLNPIWVNRDNNRKADSLSRIYDSDDWQISNSVFQYLANIWGPFTVDRFSCGYNAKCIRFNTRWWCPGTLGVDAFAQNWSNETNWMVPPPRLAGKVIDKIVKDKADGTLIVPLWKSACFWPKLFSHDKFANFVEASKVFSCKVIEKGKGRNGIFGNKNSNFNIIALKIKHV